MGFDFSGVVSRNVNAVVNKAIGSLPNYVGSLVNKTVNEKISVGTEKLLNDIGAPPIVRMAIRNINAAVMQSGVNSAGQIVSGIVNGTIRETDLKNFTNLDVVQAAIKAGNSLANDIMNINILAGVARDVTKQKPPPLEPVESNDVSPYAVDFADTFMPKHSFMFMAEFLLNPPLNESGSNFPLAKSDFHTVVYKFSRPKIQIEHEEVNMYNFITQVPKTIKYSPISFTVYDDGKQSNSMAALVSYLRTISPIFNLDASNGANLEYIGGLSFENQQNSAYLGTIQQGWFNTNLLENGKTGENIKSIFKQINVYHLYNFGQYVDVYKFFNPKITNIELDDLSMEDSKINTINFEFVYDGLYIDYQKLPSEVIQFSDLNFTAQYNPVNRNIRYGNAIRAEQQRAFEEERKRLARLRIEDEIFKRESLLQEAAVNQNLDITNDAAVEQFFRDRDYQASLGNLNNFPSNPVDNIISNVSNFTKSLFKK